MQLFYLDTENENSNFESEILGKDFDSGIFEKSDDSINIAYLNPLFQIKKVRTKNAERVIIGNLNITSLPSKFEQLKALKYVDVLVLTKTKLDNSFPKTEFLVDGFSEPYRYDRNRKGGRIIFTFVKIFK